MTAISAGKLQVDLYHDGHKISAVNPALLRPSGQVGALLRGRDPDQAVELLGMLFSICSVAHRVAATRALEAARGCIANAEIEQVRNSQVAIERLRESLMRLLLDWRYPSIDDDAAAQCIRLCKTLSQALETDPAEAALVVVELGNWWRGLRCQPTEQDIWIANHCERWRGIELGGSGKVLEPGMPGAGQPSLETGPVAAALGCRDAARVIAEVLQTLVSQVDDALALLEGETAEALAGLAQCSGDGLATGWALTARGWLMHGIELDGDRVERWQILAPTDRNFHTEGALVRRLNNVVIDRDSAEALTRELTLAIDPCVAFEVRMNDA
ncbi:hypothetical protein [Marinobacterium lutimaris]|uniref:Nickel-dependent hydrogenase n=1 Tax=Marinobacterium lutimaris TaxID=568106 RepID=A0A1H5YW71_9GAMM|nr:hypothetical protein [Marinobacterium lutimaris]SEG28000.1 hypothetical protein SAMN05444390_1011909 [Marinobacterium lutimaris]